MGRKMVPIRIPQLHDLCNGKRTFLWWNSHRAYAKCTHPGVLLQLQSRAGSSETQESRTGYRWQTMFTTITCNASPAMQYVGLRMRCQQRVEGCILHPDVFCANSRLRRPDATAAHQHSVADPQALGRSESGGRSCFPMGWLRLQKPLTSSCCATICGSSFTRRCAPHPDPSLGTMLRKPQPSTPSTVFDIWQLHTHWVSRSPWLSRVKKFLDDTFFRGVLSLSPFILLTSNNSKQVPNPLRKCQKSDVPVPAAIWCVCSLTCALPRSKVWAQVSTAAWDGVAKLGGALQSLCNFGQTVWMEGLGKTDFV